MTNTPDNAPKSAILSPQDAEARVRASMATRRNRETRFRMWGIAAIALSMCFLVTLFGTIMSKGIPGFFQYYVTLDVTLDRERLDPLATYQTSLYLMVMHAALCVMLYFQHYRYRVAQTARQQAN